MDMLTVGMRNRGNVASTGCTDVEYRTEFALWCMFASPLMLGCDVRDMDDATLKIVTNPCLLRISQDEACRAPFIVHEDCDNLKNTYARLLTNHEIAIAMTNFTDSDSRVWFALDELGLPASSGKALMLTDAFTGDVIGPVKDGYGVPVDAHDCKVYIAKVVDA